MEYLDNAKLQEHFKSQYRIYFPMIVKHYMIKSGWKKGDAIRIYYKDNSFVMRKG